MAHVYGHSVRAARSAALVPFDEQFHFGNYAFVASQKRPSLLHGLSTRISDGIENHASYLALEVYPGPGEGVPKLLRQDVPGQ